MKSIALLSFLAFTTSTLAEPLPPRQSTCPKIYDPKCSHICGQKSIDFWYCSDKNIWPVPTDDNYCTPCPRGTPTTAPKPRQSTCPKKHDPKCAYICGQKSIDFWYCSDKNIWETPTDDNWCTVCPGTPVPRPTTCSKVFDPNCSFICGQKSIDFWYCSSKNIWPIPSDDNYCTPCPRSRTVRDARKRLLAPRRLANLSEVGANACPNTKDETCRFICGKEGVDILFCSEKNIYENLVLNPGGKKNEENWCAACK
ncbi:hypothetical protein TWF594_005618 [Orbilia oligospora]|nr:hypothetical protein TWF594_005618 [Orbilia oligospora]